MALNRYQKYSVLPTLLGYNVSNLKLNLEIVTFGKVGNTGMSSIYAFLITLFTMKSNISCSISYRLRKSID